LEKSQAFGMPLFVKDFVYPVVPSAILMEQVRSEAPQEKIKNGYLSKCVGCPWG